MDTHGKKEKLKKRSDDLSAWYTDVILKAQLADYAPVKGTMVIRPYGYAIWERVQNIFNGMLAARDVQNAYFPLFIPHSLLEKEKQHIEGFSPELALVTVGGGETLADPLVVRPTSETIMYSMYAKWIKSWRDLPVLINQWNNVVRWEKRTYLFLRTMEFLWQEGHTAHETESEAKAMVMSALEWYRQIYEEYYAVPVISGRKSETEKFAGARATYSVEALMPDGKALQGATSHDLGQNFSRAFGVEFQGRTRQTDYAWQTSWGLSTSSMGGLFLTHGDDDGLILPPRIAPYQVVIIPIYKSGQDDDAFRQYLGTITDALSKTRDQDGPIRVKIDAKDNESPGRKFNTWEVRGVPLRFEIGQKEMEEAVVTVVRRDSKDKYVIKRETLAQTIPGILNEIQQGMLRKAKKLLADETHTADTFSSFAAIMKTTRGFIRAYWCGNTACEAHIKKETKATSRCLPLADAETDGKCIVCGKKTADHWIFAQAY